MKLWKAALSALVLTAALTLTVRLVLAGPARTRAAAEQEETLENLLPGGSPVIREGYQGEDESVTAVFRGGNGWVVETVTDGYVAPVKLWVGVDQSGTVTGLTVRDLHETPGLGTKALWDTDFLKQFLGRRGDAAVGENVDALTGATVTSKAIAKGVNAASAYVTGADISSGATEWGG